MRSRWASVWLAMCLIGVSGGATMAQERYEDAIGDAVGDAPDIVAVTVEEHEGSPLLSLGIKLGEERPFGSDMETWTDALFVIMSPGPTVDYRGILESETSYVTGTHAVQLEEQAETGAMFLTPNGLLEGVVDVAVDDDMLTFTFDRGLLDDPQDLFFQILVRVERDTEVEEEEGDAFPELDQPPAHIELARSED